MSTYDSYDIVEEPRRHKHRHHRDRDEPRYQEVRETYVSAPLAPEPPYSQRTELIRRPGREDSDLSIEEVQRQFPPPAGAYVQSRSMIRDERDRYGSVVRSRSADRGSQYGTYLGDPRDDRHGRKKSVVKEEIIERRRSLSRNQKIIAGVAGAALAVGGKELWDRREAASHGGVPKERNLLGTAAVGAAGAFAGYEATELYSKQMAKRDKKEKTYVAVRDRHGNTAEAYFSGSEDERPKSSRRKSIIEGALGLAGLGAVAKAAGGSKDHDGRRSRRGSSSDSYTSRRSRGGKSSRGGEGEGLAKIQQAAKAALLAGAAEAFRVRNEPGGWAGAKGKRILTAAIGAGGIDAAADRDPDHHSKRHVLEAVVGGLAGNRLVNGSRKDIDDDGRSVRGGRGGRSRSRSRAPSSGGGGAGLAALATAGLGALAGKKLMDRSRSRSRADGERRRRYSSSEEDDDRGDRRHHRSKSVSDYARKGLAALGIGEAADSSRDDRRGSTREVEETRVVHKSRRRGGSSDDDYDDRRSSGHRRRSRDVYEDDRYADSRSSVGGDRHRRKDRDSEGRNR